MNRNKKPSNKAKIFYVINAWLVFNLPPEVQLLKLIKFAPLSYTMWWI